MKIYEFITTSDAITFKAENDKVAFLTCLLLGEGKAGCRDEDGESLKTMTAFIFNQNQRNKVYKEYCGTEDIKSVFDDSICDVANALKTFAYCSIPDRKQYDEAIEAITNEKELQEYKKKHEHTNRTSISKWVANAWKYGEALLNNN